jgi:hypothetical protein
MYRGDERRYVAYVGIGDDLGRRGRASPYGHGVTDVRESRFARHAKAPRRSSY